MGKRALPAGVKCERRNITAPPRDWKRWERRAAEERRRGNYAAASVSGAIRADAKAAQLLRHELKQPLNMLGLVEASLRRGLLTAAEAADLVRDAIAEFKTLLVEEASSNPIVELQKAEPERVEVRRALPDAQPTSASTVPVP